jgi:phosphatidylserine/phosphatidylglycerophosphate/cardiolipin synthase-like enzyme
MNGRNEPLHALTVPTADDRHSFGEPCTGECAGRPHHVTARAHVPVAALFENLPEQCCNFISGADLITGCVAWLTNTRILTALSQIPAVSVIVQKEDFLRPDSNGVFKTRLRALYQQLPALGLGRTALPWTSHYTTSSEMPGDYCAIRCMGIVSRGQKMAVPRMHHKFLVRSVNRYCYNQQPPEDRQCQGICYGHPEPEAVWTGSFNMTHNGATSLENAVVIADAAIAQRYQDEWAWVLGLSEPLDWTHDWVEPELRIGS